eukprot:m.73084 g.73084  ORF g.73084 m.73084 type:complete len:835 (+) comp8411_c0_seq4:146-2650(+)
MSTNRPKSMAELFAVMEAMEAEFEDDISMNMMAGEYLTMDEYHNNEEDDFDDFDDDDSSSSLSDEDGEGEGSEQAKGSTLVGFAPALPSTNDDENNLRSLGIMFGVLQMTSMPSSSPINALTRDYHGERNWRQVDSSNDRGAYYVDGNNMGTTDEEDRNSDTIKSVNYGSGSAEEEDESNCSDYDEYAGEETLDEQVRVNLRAELLFSLAHNQTPSPSSPSLPLPSQEDDGGAYVFLPSIEDQEAQENDNDDYYGNSDDDDAVDSNSDRMHSKNDKSRRNNCEGRSNTKHTRGRKASASDDDDGGTHSQRYKTGLGRKASAGIYALDNMEPGFNSTTSSQAASRRSSRSHRQQRSALHLVLRDSIDSATHAIALCGFSQFYVTTLPRDAVDARLRSRENGAFLVRHSSSFPEKRVLCVKFDSIVLHYLLQRFDGELEGHIITGGIQLTKHSLIFRSLMELLSYYSMRRGILPCRLSLLFGDDECAPTNEGDSKNRKIGLKKSISTSVSEKEECRNEIRHRSATYQPRRKLVGGMKETHPNEEHDNNKNIENDSDQPQSNILKRLMTMPSRFRSSKERRPTSANIITSPLQQNEEMMEEEEEERLTFPRKTLKAISNIIPKRFLASGARRVTRHVRRHSLQKMETEGRTILNFISCTESSLEKNLTIICRNVRQFMDGMRNFFSVQYGRKYRRWLSDGENVDAESVESIIEAVLQEAVCGPLNEKLSTVALNYLKRDLKPKMLGMGPLGSMFVTCDYSQTVSQVISTSIQNFCLYVGITLCMSFRCSTQWLHQFTNSNESYFLWMLYTPRLKPNTTCTTSPVFLQMICFPLSSIF